MERAHRELGSRLSDRLSGDHTHGLALVHELSAGEIASVASAAHAEGRLAGEYRADHDVLDAGILDGPDLLLVDLLTGFDQYVVADRVFDSRQGNPPQDALADRLDDLAPFDQSADGNTIGCAAVDGAHDHVLRHIHETAGQVARIGGLERGIGQPLSGTVGRDEVLEHREPFTKVRSDGSFDDLSRGLGHEAAHPGELTHLLGRTARPGVGHHVDGVEARDLSFLAVFVPFDLGPQPLQHLVGHLLRCVGPDVDHFVVALSVGDQTFLVLLFDLLNLGLRRFDELFLVLRDLHVVNRHRDPSSRGVAVAQSAQPIGEKNGGLGTESAIALIDQLAEGLLVHYLVDDLEGDLVRDDLLEEHPTRRRFDELAVDAHLDRRVESQLAQVVYDPDLMDVRKDHARAEGTGCLARHVVAAQHDILAGTDDGATGRRAQDVVGRHHEHPSFDLGFYRQGHVDRHLIAIEVCVERRAYQRVELDRLAVDELGLEGLDAQAVQSRSSVQEDRVLLNHLGEDVPDLGVLLLDHLLRGLDRGHVAALFELRVDEGFEELYGH